MPTRFAIVCMGRTGSTMLQNLLDSHPEIECKHELFHPDAATKANTFYRFDGQVTRREYLQDHAFETPKPIKGFKMPIEWLAHQPGIFEDFRDLGYRIIRLHRRSLLDHFLSARLAAVNNNWTSETEYEEQRIVLDPWDLVQFAAMRDYQTVLMDQLCRGCSMIKVDYEDLQSTKAQERLARFLGARSGQRLSTPTVRSRTSRLPESIENFSSLMAFLDQTPWRSLTTTVDDP